MTGDCSVNNLREDARAFLVHIHTEPKMELATFASPSSLIAVTISVFITTESSVIRIPSSNISVIEEIADCDDVCSDEIDEAMALDRRVANWPTVSPPPFLMDSICSDDSLSASSIADGPPNWDSADQPDAWAPAAFPVTKSSRRMFPGRGPSPCVPKWPLLPAA